MKLRAGVTSRWFRLGGIVVFISFIGLFYFARHTTQATPMKDDPQITVCYPSGNCATYEATGPALQLAFSQAANEATITIPPGLYLNTSSTLTVSQKYWRYDGALNTNCENKDYVTSFLIQNKSHLTIRSSSTVTDTIILGGEGDADHGLTIADSTNIDIVGVSIFSDGGREGNGVSDAALNVVRSTGSVRDSILSGNKARVDPSGSTRIDQEGITLFGPSTQFTVSNNIIANNFHTGITLLHGASGVISGNLITRNGYEGHMPLGPGITSFYHSELGNCFDGNVKIKAWNNIVTDNSGMGISVRGQFTGGNVIEISHNTIYNNKMGIRIGPEEWGMSSMDINTFSNGAELRVLNNMILGNHYGAVKIDPAPTTTQGGLAIDSSSSISISNNASYLNTNDNSDFIPSLSSGRIFVQNNIITDTLRNTYFELPTASPLKNAGWTYPGAANQSPDISSYEHFNNTAMFNSALLTTICPQYNEINWVENNVQRLDAPNIRCSYGTTVYLAFLPLLLRN